MVAGLGIEVKGIRGRSGSDVAMNDALGVGRIQGVGDLDADFRMRSSSMGRLPIRDWKMIGSQDPQPQGTQRDTG